MGFKWRRICHQNLLIIYAFETFWASGEHKLRDLSVFIMILFETRQIKIIYWFTLFDRDTEI